MTLFPEILPWVQAGLTQQQVAVKTWTHLQSGGALPFVAPIWPLCPYCKVARSGLVHAFKPEPDGFIELEHVPCSHRVRVKLIRTLPAVYQNIGRSKDPNVIDHTVAQRNLRVQKLLRRFDWERPDPLCLAPDRFLRYALYALEVPQNHRFSEPSVAPWAYVLEEMARHYPICGWVDAHVGAAVQNSIAPDIDLGSVEWHQHRNIYFVRPGQFAGTQGSISAFGYSLIPNGIFDVLDIPGGFANVEPFLLVWALEAESNVWTFVQVPLSGTLKEVSFSQKPGLVDFARRLVAWVLILNLLCLTPQAQLTPTEVLRQRPPTKKERRKGELAPRITFRPSYLTFRSQPSRGTGAKNGVPMRPHNKPGWLQRYHSREGVRWIYRPPHRVNGHLDAGGTSRT